jgi:hypothetical protein
MVLQNSMDLLNSEPGSSNETKVTSTVGGKEVTGIETERASYVSVVADQGGTIPAIKTEPNVSCVPVVSVTHISYRLHPEMPAPISVCPCEKNLTGEWILSSFKIRSLYFGTHCM